MPRSGCRPSRPNSGALQTACRVPVLLQKLSRQVHSARRRGGPRRRRPRASAAGATWGITAGGSPPLTSSAARHDRGSARDCSGLWASGMAGGT
eukprot:6227288-Alexandrium_andersonii.AAC.1